MSALRRYNAPRQHQCDFCSQRFAKPQHLHRHHRVHTGSRPFVCNDCGKKFARRDTLMRHTTTHNATQKKGLRGASHQNQSLSSRETSPLDISVQTGGGDCTFTVLNLPSPNSNSIFEQAFDANLQQGDIQDLLRSMSDSTAQCSHPSFLRELMVDAPVWEEREQTRSTTTQDQQTLQFLSQHIQNSVGPHTPLAYSFLTANSSITARQSRLKKQ